MEKGLKHALTLMLLSILSIIVLSGCRNDSDIDDNDSGQSGKLYTAEVIPFPELPAGYDNINNITLVGDTVYFTASFSDHYADEATNSFKSGVIFAMTIEGTNLRKLPDYSTETPPPAATGGSLYIDAINADGQGSIWVVETGRYYILEEPDIIVDAGSTHTIRKLDSNGAELISTDIGNLSVGLSGFYVSMFIVDAVGYIYIGCGFIGSDETIIYVLDSDCNVLFQLEASTWHNSFILTHDDSVAFVRLQNNEKFLQKIDVPGKSWGDSTHLSENALNVFSGDNDFLVLFTDSTSLYGLSGESGEVVQVLSWMDVGVIPEGLEIIAFLHDERILVIKSTIRPGSGISAAAQINALIFLEETESVNAELSKKTELTLGTLSLNPILQNAIHQFNNSSTTHYITVIDYSSNTTPDDIQGALLRFTTEITVGRVPDILILTSMPFDRLIAHDLLIDLYPFLDADEKLSRESLFESVLKANERNGKLYLINQTFSISSLLGSPSVLGEYPGWNMEEFKAVIDANPQADLPLGTNFTKHDLLWTLLYMNLYEYVDMNSKTADFNNDGFIELLKFINTFPSEIDFEDKVFDQLFNRELKAEGRQIMDIFVSRLNQFILQKESFGGEIVIKGWPTADRNGSRFISHDGVAISTRATDKEGAWEFVRTLLMEEHQRDLLLFGFSINKSVFEEHMQQDMRGTSYLSEGVQITIEPTREDVDEIVALINSITKIAGHGSDEMLRNIIIETATDFFNRLISAEDAARIIQNRVTIFLAEQN